MVSHIEKSHEVSDPRTLATWLWHNKKAVEADYGSWGNMKPSSGAISPSPGANKFTEKYAKSGLVLEDLQIPDPLNDGLEDGDMQGTKMYMPEEVGYVQSTTPKQCRTCSFFKAPNICNLPLSIPVDGKDGCCNEWREGEKFMEAKNLSSKLGIDQINAQQLLTEDGANPSETEKEFLKRAQQAIDMAVDADRQEELDPQNMEAIEDFYIKKALMFLNAAYQAHNREGGNVGETANLPDFMGHNLDAQTLSKIISRYMELHDRGIPDLEIIKTIAGEYSFGAHSMEPGNVKEWPPEGLGKMDNAGVEFPKKIPAEAFSPPVPKGGQPPADHGPNKIDLPMQTDDLGLDDAELESVAIGGGLSGTSIGGKTLTPSAEESDGRQNREPYTALGAQKNSEPPMHGYEPTYNTRMQPEEAFYTKWPQIEAEPETFINKDTAHSEDDERIDLTPLGSLDIDVKEPSDDDNPTKEQMGQPPLKLRQKARFVYVNHGHTSKYQEQKGLHVCEQLNNSVWDMADSRRPILPMENAGITNTHPNCKCHWDYFTEIDPDPMNYGAIHKPTLNGQPLEDFNWKGQAIEHLAKVNNIISNKYQIGSLHPIDGEGKLQPVPSSAFQPESPAFGAKEASMCKKCVRKIPKKVRKMIREATSLRKEFQWLTPGYVDRVHDLQKKLGGKFYLVRASAVAITDHRGEGEPYRRKLDGDELHALARTGIGKGTDINHDATLATEGHVLDGDYDKDLEQIQFLVHESDPEIIKAIDDGVIDAVSINGGSPRNEEVGPCDEGCDSGSCELCLHPRGVVLGEDDNIAFTWVVTDPKGMRWRGKYIEPATPGVKITKIESL